MIQGGISMAKKQVKRLEADVVIAGGGPGGCVLAQDLSRKGKKVILIEKGGHHTRGFGSMVGLMLGGHMERAPGGGFLSTTIEGDQLVLGTGVGGGTILFAGSAFLPEIDLWKEVGVDLEPYLDGAMEESWVHEPPDEFIGPGTRRLWDAARELGYSWGKALRHIDFDKCKVGCGLCGAGCTRDAKWTGKVQADEAVRHGATLLTYVKVRDVIVENGVAVGVRGRGVKDSQSYEVYGKAVVCCAGGVGTAPILRRSGLYEAGNWLSGDPTIMSYGFLEDEDGIGNGFEQQMTVCYHDEEYGCVFCSCIATPASTWRMQILQKEGLGAALKSRPFRKALGIFSKMHDDGVGQIFVGGGVSKTYTEKDVWMQEYSRVTNERILIQAGCDPHDIHHSGLILGHPSGTVKIGKLLDPNLETQIKNLYCCDTSVMPEAPGRPPALTVVTLAKRLAKRLETIV
jgi:choline dehydrogenase-like flavoprotein